jgi:hypothetical protein
MTLPDGWDPARAAGAAVAARPAGDDSGSLTVSLSKDPVASAEQTEAVKLGALEAWRAASPGSKGQPAGVRFVIPTRTGKVVANCLATRPTAADLLPACERAASTLRIAAVTPVPLATVVKAEGERWRLAVGRLRVDRTAGLRKLIAARKPFGQALAADALARVHDRAVRRFSPLVGGAPVVSAARATAADYRALAAAVRAQSTPAWNAAQARVRADEAKLLKAVDSRG